MSDLTTSLETAVAQAVALARRGDWTGAEAALHNCLRTVPPAELPRAYIACVELIARLTPAGDLPVLRVQVPAGPRAVGPAVPPAAPGRPRLLSRSDPALDYAHAVLTALRSRLAARPGPARQAS